MAARTKSCEIILSIATKETSRLDVVYLKVFQATAMLAPPTIPGQDTVPQPLVSLWIKPQLKVFRVMRAHEAVSICWRSSAFIGSGRSSMSRHSDISNVAGSPSPRCAPARKSAQIISRQ